MTPAERKRRRLERAREVWRDDGWYWCNGNRSRWDFGDFGMIDAPRATRDTRARCVRAAWARRVLREALLP